jgi:hypothetical protein
MLNTLKTSLADMLILPTSEKDGPTENVCTIAGYLYFTNSHHIPYAAVSLYIPYILESNLHLVFATSLNEKS